MHPETGIINLVEATAARQPNAGDRCHNSRVMGFERMGSVNPRNVILSLLLLSNIGLSCSAKTAVNADEALKRLKEGNARYMHGKSVHPRFDPVARESTAREGQTPIATILGCSDARVPPEIIFDQGFGELFIVRVAGNVVAPAELASIEYGTKYLGTPLIVVLGHTQCGAVEGALSGAELRGNLPQLMAMISPTLTQLKKDKPGLKGEALSAAAVEANVRHSMNQIISGSPGLSAKLKMKKIQLVGAVRDISSGTVRWLSAEQ